MAFFFLNLFAHIGIPLAMAVVFWLHVKRLARPRLLPSLPLMWLVIGALTATAAFRPLTMAPEANALVLPVQVPVGPLLRILDPHSQNIGGGNALLVVTALSLGLLAVPCLTARGAAAPRRLKRGRADLCGVQSMRAGLPVWRDHDGRARRRPSHARGPGRP